MSNPTTNGDHTNVPMKGVLTHEIRLSLAKDPLTVAAPFPQTMAQANPLHTRPRLRCDSGTSADREGQHATWFISTL